MVIFRFVCLQLPTACTKSFQLFIHSRELLMKNLSFFGANKLMGKKQSRKSLNVMIKCKIEKFM